MQKQVIVYVDHNGKKPFREWLDNLQDSSGRQRIIQRILRLEQGYYGDRKSVGEGVHELRMFFGPGYRAYFGEDGKNIVILLCGGDKDSQRNDIKQAKAYWKEYKERDKLPNCQ